MLLVFFVARTRGSELSNFNMALVRIFFCLNDFLSFLSSHDRVTINKLLSVDEIAIVVAMTQLESQETLTRVVAQT